MADGIEQSKDGPKKLHDNGDGTFSEVEYLANAASAATTSNVASSATVVTLLAANLSRHGALFYNDSTAVLYLKLGSAASATSYTVQLAAGGYYELPLPTYQGIITGIWASANGNARITELT